jgi:hypothetical protein
LNPYTEWIISQFGLVESEYAWVKNCGTSAGDPSPLF